MQRRQTLAQYDQVSAQAAGHGGALDTKKLTGWLHETNANTMSFLLWDTDGHQYLDMVRFLEATKADEDLEVWVNPWANTQRRVASTVS